MSENGSEFTTPAGRVVWGHPAKPRDKTKDGQPVRDAAGNVTKQTAFGIAIPKADFDQHVRPWLEYEAGTTFTTGIPRDFAWKYVDGDSPEAPWSNGKQGTPLNSREGYAGHYVLTCSTELPGMPQCFVFQNGGYFQIGADGLKTGDWVRVKINAKAHGGQSPGLYINPQLVELVGVGQAIVGSGGGGDPMAAFGGQAAQLPPGVTAPGAAPMGAPPTPAVAPQQPAAPAYAPQPGQAPYPGVPAPGSVPPAPSPQLPPPATNFIPGAPPVAAPPQQPSMPQPGQAPYPGMPAPR